MKSNLLLVLIMLAFTLVAAISCTASPAPVTTTPAIKGSTVQPEIEPPVIKEILGPNEAALSEDTLYTCWASDPEGRKMTYEWSADGGTILPSFKKEVIWKTPDKSGRYTITVKVTNDAGASASLSRDINMVEMPKSHQFTDNTVNLKLQIPGNAVAVQASRVVSTTTEIQCSVDGMDQSQLTYKWTSQIGKLAGAGIAEGKASRVGWIAPGTPGQYTVRVTVSDQSGREAKGEINFDIVAQ